MRKSKGQIARESRRYVQDPKLGTVYHSNNQGQPLCLERRKDNKKRKQDVKEA